MTNVKLFSKFKYLILFLLVSYHSPLISATGNWILYVTNTSGNGGQPPSYAVLPIKIPRSGTPTQDGLPTISLQPTGPNPMDIAITPNSQLAVAVASDGISSEVALINIANNTVISSLTNAGNAPVAVAITPDGNRAYVPNLFDDTVASIDIKNNNTLMLHSTIPVGSGPNSVAIGVTGSNSSGMAYVGNGNDTSVTVINTTNDHVVTTITGAGIGINGNPMDIAIHPNGNVVYVVSFRDNHVAVINPFTNSVVGAVSVGAQPRAIVISSDGTKAYVSNFGSNTVSVLNLSPTPLPLPTLSATISGFNQPSILAITPDANTIYVSDPANNRIAILNTLTNTITGSITQASANLILPPNVPFFPGGFIVTPDQAPIAAFTATDPPLDVVFDASASSSPVGTIVSYFWDFGDGTTALTSDPIITHIYNQEGTYQVTLTVTNSAGTSTTQIFTGRTVSNNGGPSAITTQLVSIAPLPPSNFRGIIKKNKFLNRTEYILKATWDASSSIDVVLYRIYKSGHLVDEVLANSPLIFKTCLQSEHSAKKYEISSVSSDNLESILLKIKVVHE